MRRVEQLRSEMVLPDRRHESWRKLDLGGLKLRELPGLSNGKDPGSAGKIEISGPVLDVWQGADFWKKSTYYSRPDSSQDEMRKGSLAELFLFNPGGAAFLSVGGEGRIHIRHVRGDLPWLATRLVINVAPGARLVIVEELEKESLQLQCPVTDLELGEGANVEYVTLSRPSEDCYYFHNWQASMGRDSQLLLKYYHGGGLRGKNYYRTSLMDRGANVQATCVASGAGREVLDMHMLMDHRASHTESRIDYRTVLADHAHSIFNGNLLIGNALRAIHSRQTNRNIVLGQKARAESMPNLIIKAESVSCEHGATVGQLDQAALFYLMSRGLTETEARSMLVHGFLDENVRQFPEEFQKEIQDSIRERIKA